MKRFWTWARESYGVLLSLCVFYPVLFFLRNNSHMFQVCEIFEGLGWVFLGCLPLFLLDIGTRSWKPRGRPQRWLDAGVVGVGMTLVIMLAIHPACRDMLEAVCDIVGLRHFLWCLPAPLIALAALKWRKKLVVGSLATLCGIAICVTLQREYQAAQIDKKLLPPAKALPITFKKKPNIYLFTLESYVDNTSLREIYHMNSDKLMALLDKQGFTVIENCFANYNYTLASISSIFLMKHHYYLAEVGDRSITRGILFRTMAGENPVICTLKANGYAINYIDFKGGIFTLFQRGLNIDLFLSHINRSHLCLLFSLRFNLFNTMMLFVIRELFHLEAEAEDDIPQYRVTSAQPGVVELLSQKKESPTCTIVYMGADHVGHGIVPSSVEKSGENKYDYFARKAYPDLRRQADEDLIAMLELIQKHDPEALIILIGDHAAHRYTSAHWRYNREHNDWARVGGVSPNAAIHSYGLEPSLVGRDHVGVLCAIRWPQDVTHYSAGRVISHVNLFRHVFASLAEDPAVLAQGYQSDESYVPVVSASGVHDNTRLYCVARDGKLLDDWEVFTPPPLE